MANASSKKAAKAGSEVTKKYAPTFIFSNILFIALRGMTTSYNHIYTGNSLFIFY
jgi:hypothetical protein